MKIKMITAIAVGCLLSGMVSAASLAAEEEFLETFVSDDNVAFALKEVDPNGEWGYTWKALIENKTDKEVMFSMEDVAINGVVCDPYFADTLSGNAKENVDIEWFSDKFDTIGITEVTSVSFTLNIYDNEDWSLDPYVYDTFCYYPNGEENAIKYTRESQDSDIVLFDNDECSFIITEFGINDWDEYTAFGYLVNKTDSPAMFAIDSAVVNGYECDPYWATTVPANCVEYSEINWSMDTFKENGIEEVESIKLQYRVYDDMDYDKVYAEDECTLEPNK